MVKIRQFLGIQTKEEKATGSEGEIGVCNESDFSKLIYPIIELPRPKAT
jgi:hypothetical protein